MFPLYKLKPKLVKSKPKTKTYITTINHVTVELDDLLILQRIMCILIADDF